VYPTAGEAIIVLGRGTPADLGSGGNRVRSPEPVAQAENRARSVRRARQRARRYAVANNLTRLATLTSREAVFDRATMLRRVGRFGRALRARYGPLAYLTALEWHPGGHGLHVHVALDRYVPKDELSRLWGYGFVDVRLMRTRRGGQRGAAARAAAGYVSKYVTKAAAEWPGQHAYEVGQGFQPERVRFDGTDLVRGVLEIMGGEVPSYVWESSTLNDWRGPPVLFLAWG
jgi:hypothetical protein